MSFFKCLDGFSAGRMRRFSGSYFSTFAGFSSVIVDGIKVPRGRNKFLGEIESMREFMRGLFS